MVILGCVNGKQNEVFDLELWLYSSEFCCWNSQRWYLLLIDIIKKNENEIGQRKKKHKTAMKDSLEEFFINPLFYSLNFIQKNITLTCLVRSFSKAKIVIIVNKK